MLAAEDNVVNKKLIPRLLEKAEFPLQAAGDGFQAAQAMAPLARAMEADDERSLLNRPELAATLDRWIPRPAEAARNSCPS